MTYIDGSQIPQHPGTTRVLREHGSILRVAVRPIDSAVLRFVGDHFGVEYSVHGEPETRFITDFSGQHNVRAVPVEAFEGRFG